MLNLFALFYTAQSYENDLDFENAYLYYDKMYDQLVDSDEYRDIALFHKARMLYLQTKYSRALHLFNTIVDDHGSGNYAERAKSYLLLINYLMHIDKK